MTLYLDNLTTNKLITKSVNFKEFNLIETVKI